MVYRAPPNHGITPQGRGRFGDFDVLDQVHEWDPVTAGVVMSRLALPTELAFFSPEEVAIAGPLLDLLMGQHDDPRVPVLQLIDERLARNETDGWHYDDMPEDAQAWRQTLRALDADAQERHSGRRFGELVDDERRELISAVQKLGDDGKPWHDWSATHVWSLWTRYACTAFYSHPWAWNEMGFPGPAYPRGYLALGVNGREHHEVADPDPQASPNV